MKIFFDNKIFINQIHGGPSVYFINLIKNLKDLDCEVKLSSKLHLNEYLDQNKKKIVDECFKIPFNKSLVKVNYIKNLLHSYNYKSHIKKIKFFNPDVIHTTYYNKYFLESKKSQKVLTVFDLIVEKFPELYKINKNYLPKKEILNQSDKIICISENTKKDLINFYNIDEKKINVIYLGYPSKKKLIKIMNDPYILFVGTRWKYKNFFNFIKAFSQNKKIKNNFKIICFGGGNFSKDEKINLVKLGLDENKITHIEGDETLLHSYYKSASVFIYPSLYEGFGLPILESFLYECPVVCSKTSSLPEVAGSGAMYFDPQNIESISYALETVLYSVEKQKKLIKEGTNQLKKFSWKKTSQKTLDFYKI